MRQLHGRLMGVLALILVVSSFVPAHASAQDTPAATAANLSNNATIEIGPCPFTVPQPLVEGETLECGFLTTPLRHADPDGEQIRLFVTRLISPASDKLETPLVYLAGGPGQGGTGQLMGFLPEGQLYPLVEHQDVILVDQRGTGFSEPGLFCPTDAGPGIVGLPSDEDSTPAAEAPLPQATPDVAGSLTGGSPEQFETCKASLDERGIDLTAFSSAESAADIDDLRAAFGYDQVDLYGVSYGSALGFVIERDFPKIVRAAVLASPAPLQVDRFTGQVIAFDQSLDEAIAQCESDPDCFAANPDLSTNFDLVVEQLNAEPLDIELVEPNTGKSLGNLSMDGEQFMFAVYEGLYIAPAIVPSLITGAVNGETETFGVILGVAYSVIQSSLATGLNTTINCTEEYPFVNPREEEDTLGADNDVRETLANSAQFDTVATYDTICDIWNLPAADPVETEPVVSDVPTLILSGEFDPITPPGYGDLAVETLENGYVIEIPGASHDPVGLAGPAGVQLIVDFMADPTRKPDTTAIEQNQVDFSPEQ